MIVSVQFPSHDLKKKKKISEVVRKSSSGGKWMISPGENSRTQLSFQRTRTKHGKEHAYVLGNEHLILVEII